MFPTSSFETMSFKSKKKKKICIIPCFKTYNTMSVADIVLFNCCEFVLCLGYIPAKFGVDWLRFSENRILLLHNANCLIFWHYHFFPIRRQCYTDFNKLVLFPKYVYYTHFIYGRIWIFQTTNVEKMAF